MKQRKPLIGVTPLFDEERGNCWMLPGYMQGIEQAGGVAVMLPLYADAEAVERLIEELDGLLVCGGPDIASALYGEEILPVCSRRKLCPERDALETALLKRMLEADKAVLGICRGHQMLNVALGGSLYQNLPTQRPGEIVHKMQKPNNRVAHTIQLCAGTPLAEVLGLEQIGVNSCHHQAICRLAPGLSPMAVSQDGVIEAVYMPDKSFIWGVQWHPEMFLEDAASQRIFRAFVRACAIGTVGK